MWNGGILTPDGSERVRACALPRPGPGRVPGPRLRRTSSARHRLYCAGGSRLDPAAGTTKGSSAGAVSRATDHCVSDCRTPIACRGCRLGPMTDRTDPPFLHQGPDHSAPYPLSRLAPAFHDPDLASEVAQAEALLGARTMAKLGVIAEQIQSLQQAARRVLDEAREERALNHAQCAFRRIPGHTYHLYRKVDGGCYFSMLSPSDWRGRPPHPFVGSYRLGIDWSWTPAGPAADP